MLGPSSRPWNPDETLADHLEARGISRRDFMGFCTKLATVLDLGIDNLCQYHSDHRLATLIASSKCILEVILELLFQTRSLSKAPPPNSMGFFSRFTYRFAVFPAFAFFFFVLEEDLL